MVLVSRGSKLTMTLHADMVSGIANQRFNLKVSKTYDRPFIPRGALQRIKGQTANENIINTYTVTSKRIGTKLILDDKINTKITINRNQTSREKGPRF